MDNYALYKDFLKDKYRFSEDNYQTEIDNSEKYLMFYERMNVFPMFPSPIILRLNHIDIKLEKNNKLDISLGTNQELNKKMKEFAKIIPELSKLKSADKVRRFFDYEIRDQLSKIVLGTYITNAWTKMYEILIAYNLFSDIEKQINTFHICEHPGAFIYAVKDYIKFTYPNKKHNFIFQSLNPKLEKKQEIFKVETKLMLGSKDNLDYGVQGTGDITDIKNILGYREKYFDQKFDLITSDCGLDCSDDFTQQENTLVPIFFGAFLCAIGLLSKKGNYVWKLFSFQSPKTIELLTLCCKYFEKVDIVRLMTDKSGSGEIYAMCQNFLFEKKDVDLTELINYYKNYKSGYILKSIPDKLVNQLVKYDELLTTRRITNYNLLLFRFINRYFTKDNEQIKKYIKDMANCYARYFIRYIKLDEL